MYDNLHMCQAHSLSPLLYCGATFANGPTDRVSRKTVRLRQQWDAMKIQVAEKDLLAVQANQALSPNLKRCHMIQALQAMASNHSNAINEERKLLQSELEQGIIRLKRKSLLGCFLISIPRI